MGKWTDESKRRFAELWLAGEGVNRIAQACGKDVKQIGNMRVRMNLPPRKGATRLDAGPRPAGFVNRLKTMHIQGISYGRIAADLGVSISLVRREAARLGLPKRKQIGVSQNHLVHVKFSKEERARLGRAAFVKGVTMSQFVRSTVLARL